MPVLELDTRYSGCVAGTDEAGRGPLCGPVYAAAVILDPARPIEGLNDSKKLNEAARERLFGVICAQATAWAIAKCSAAEIDRFNILRASHLAMERAVAQLGVVPERVLVDGNRLPKHLNLPAEAVVKGDARHSAIAAASILAKVARDRVMRELHEQFPHYDLGTNKGYPTPVHLSALEQHGPCAEHRRSFAPVRRWLEQTNIQGDLLSSSSEFMDT
ncbi:ribonuclease HII [Salinispirillum sp. LH 10-3-1]|uniref:Ribonuclease HII n=1 Tax=Salinispirillum sp. LH 10-3-1 TaxID=2952525 RepID=A0AB38YIZ5_9GAMM